MLLGEDRQCWYMFICSLSTLQSGVWKQLWLIRHPGLKTQVHVICDKASRIAAFRHTPSVTESCLWHNMQITEELQVKATSACELWCAGVIAMPELNSSLWWRHEAGTLHVQHRGDPFSPKVWRCDYADWQRSRCRSLGRLHCRRQLHALYKLGPMLAAFPGSHQPAELPIISN